MSFGSQTVVLRSYSEGGGRDRLNQPTRTPTDVPVSGVLMRPFRPTEVVALTDIAIDVWRCTAPPVAAALGATASGLLLYDGTDSPADVKENRFQITGVEPFSDLSGVVDHVRITCQRQSS